MYPVEKFIRTTVVDGRVVPGYAPAAAADPLEAYAAFLHDSREEAEAELQSDIASRAADMAEDDEDEDDDYFDEEGISPCIVQADGSIEFEGGVLKREDIFGVYGVEDVPPAPRF